LDKVVSMAGCIQFRHDNWEFWSIDGGKVVSMARCVQFRPVFWNPDWPGGSTRDPDDPGLEPVRLEVKTRLEVGPVKPGRPGRSTRDPVHPVKPGWDPVYFFLVLAAIKRRRYKSLSQPTKNHVPLFLFNFPHYLFIRPCHLFLLYLFLDFLFNFMSHYHRFFCDIF